MRALTIYQPWASLIACGAKPYEFRRHDRFKHAAGERIVIHASIRAVQHDEIDDIRARIADGETSLDGPLATAILDTSHDGRALIRGYGLGTALLGAPKRATELFGDSDRIDHEVWAYPLTDFKAFAPPVPMRGFQGLWTWPERIVA